VKQLSRAKGGSWNVIDLPPPAGRLHINCCTRCMHVLLVLNELLLEASRWVGADLWAG
jgi:hypothetical protein